MNNLLPRQGELYLIENFFTQEESDVFYQTLKKSIPWEQQPITMFGKKVMQPRLTSWHGDENCRYKYSGLQLTPKAWTPELLEIKCRIEAAVDSDFNSVLLNNYRDENDSMGWHRDDEKELGPNPLIASVSFGATREFQIRHLEDHSLKFKILLPHGSLLVMGGACQHHWQHAIPKTKAAHQPRINLTFRKIKTT